MPPGAHPEWSPDGSRTRRINRLAIASLVLAILWLGWLGSVLGVIFGFVAHRQIRRSEGWQRGDSLALAGTVIGMVGLALLAAGIVQDRHHASTPHATPVAPTGASAAPIDAGANVAVVASGFTQSGGSAGNSISYGIVLENKSHTLTAVAVKVMETFLDAHGRSVATDTQTLTGIPAGARFDVGGETFSNVSLQVSKFEVAVKVGGSISNTILIPLSSDVAFTKDLASVVGSLRNPYKVALPSDATVFLVYTDAQGQIVGGDSESTGAAVQPGQSVSFSDNLISITPKPGTTVAASIDPDGYPAPGSGDIRWSS